VASGRLVGVDIGERRIGVAMSDELGVLASAHSVLRSVGRARDASAVAAIAREADATTIVIGLPLTMGGQEGQQADKARRFGEAVSKHELEVVFWDDRLTTREAQRRLQDAGMRRAKRAATIDAAAAAVLLQSYLDARRALA
jgi:putative Holliday junction resolvase